jgi:hypothetical protein
LQNQYIPITVNDQARQAIGFGVDQAKCIGVKCQVPGVTCADGGAYLSAEEICVNRFVVKRPDARTDLGGWRVRGAGQEIPIKREQVHGPARGRLVIHMLDRARKYPRMAAQE